jgi:hypothetical protein
MEDLVLSGRAARGAKNVNNVLSEAQAIEIKQRLARGEKMILISRAMAVSYRSIAHIKYGVTWKHVT